MEGQINESTQEPKERKSYLSKKNKTKKPAAKKAKKLKRDYANSIGSKYPRHSIEKSLRIPRAIIDQNAGKECTQSEAANYCHWSTGLLKELVLGYG